MELGYERNIFEKLMNAVRKYDKGSREDFMIDFAVKHIADRKKEQLFEFGRFYINPSDDGIEFEVRTSFSLADRMIDYLRQRGEKIDISDCSDISVYADYSPFRKKVSMSCVVYFNRGTISDYQFELDSNDTISFINDAEREIVEQAELTAMEYVNQSRKAYNLCELNERMSGQYPDKINELIEIIDRLRNMEENEREIVKTYSEI